MFHTSLLDFSRNNCVNSDNESEKINIQFDIITKASQKRRKNSEKGDNCITEKFSYAGKVGTELNELDLHKEKKHLEIFFSPNRNGMASCDDIFYKFCALVSWHFAVSRLNA